MAGIPMTPAGSSWFFNNKTRLIFVGLVLALALGYLVYSAFPGSAVYYLTVGEFLDGEGNADGRSVRVVGKLVPGSFQRVEGSTTASFSITDEGQTLNAIYNGVVPDIFFSPHSEIVVEGSYGEGFVFHAEDIIVKCPSKYQALREDA